MKNKITVNKAISRGHLMINLPVFVLLVCVPGLTLYLCGDGPFIIIGILAGFCLSWLTWSIMVTKWRIWAFENVQNVHDLRKRAVEEKLIWREGSLFERTEIRTAADREKLNRLESKFLHPDVYKEDRAVPFKTEVFYFRNYVEIFIAVGISGVGVYLLTMVEIRSIISGSILIILGIYNLITQAKKEKDKGPQVTIDSKGILTKEAKFKSWSEIYDEQVIKEGFGKTTKNYLVYRYGKRNYAKIDLDELEIRPEKLENALRTYRIRHTNSTS